MKTVIALLCLFAMARAEEKPAQPLGLYVQDGVLSRAGHPYQGIGANYFSLFSRILTNPADDSSLKNLARLGKDGIPFVRFMCGGFWPTDMKLYQDDKPEYFRRLDLVVRGAETAKIGLIPSLFWNFSTVADLCGEPLDQYANKDSKSIAFIRQYTTEVVTRYKDSPAIWAWEFGNEYNLSADLPSAVEHRPAVWPLLGTPKERSSRDELKWQHVEMAFRVFAETAKHVDSNRVILNGNASPRASAWHNFHEKNWTDDTEQQFFTILNRDNPAPFNALCVHLYPEAKYGGGQTNLDGIIGVLKKQSEHLGKPLFIGEFGVSKTTNQSAQQAVFDEFLRAIKKHQVPLAAFWVFDLSNQDADWNVTYDNERAWMLQRVAQANREIGKSDAR